MYKFDNVYENIAIQQIEALAVAIDKLGNKFDVIEKEANSCVEHSDEFDDVYEVLRDTFDDKRIFDHEPSLDELNSNEYQNNCEVVNGFLSTIISRNNSFSDTMKRKLNAFLTAYFNEIV